MPFTPPSTYASQATTGYEAVFGTGPASSTSTSSIAVGTGALTFTTATGLSYAAGNNVRIVSSGSGATLLGTVTSYNSGTGSLVVNISSTIGTSTHTDWVINTYTLVLEVKSFTNNMAEVPEVQISQLLSPSNTEEMIPGMIKPGTIEVGGNFIGDATQLNFTTLMQNQTVFPFEVLANVQRGKTYILTGQGFIKNYKNGPFENNKPVEFSVQIQMTGTYTEAVAA